MGMFLTEHFAIPGDVGFPLSGILSPPANRNEGERFRAYMKQVRSGFRVSGFQGFRVLGFRVQGSGFRVQGSGFRVRSVGSSVQSVGVRVMDLGLRVDVLGSSSAAILRMLVAKRQEALRDGVF